MCTNAARISAQLSTDRPRCDSLYRARAAAYAVLVVLAVVACGTSTAYAQSARPLPAASSIPAHTDEASSSPRPSSSAKIGHVLPPSPSASVSPQPTAGGGDGRSGGFSAWLWMLTVLAVVGGIVWFFRWAFRGEDANRMARILGTLTCLYILGAVSTPFLGLPGNGWLVLNLVGFGVSILAGLIGFLFGLPQTVRQVVAAPTTAPSTKDGTTHASAVVSTSVTPQDSDGGLRPSTNLETVAEQLTKYATGAAFASVAAAAGYVATFGDWIYKAIPVPEARVLGGMFFIGYGALGFVIAYIVTRTDVSESFRNADDRVLHRGSEVLAASLPDVGEDANDEQRYLAAAIVKQAYQRLSQDSQRLTWARAQVIQGDYGQARMAYAALYASNAHDPDIIMEFATALYNDSTFDDDQFVLHLIGQAKRLVRADDAERQARIANLTAATYLYVSGGYVNSILAANDLLGRGIAPTKTLRFYRACGFGQMYRAYKDNGKLTAADDAELSLRITMDSAITIALGNRYRGLVVAVANPHAGSTDDDLTAFAADHPEYATKTIGLAAPPAYPDPRSDGEPVLVYPLPGGVTPAVMASQSPP
jgi:hypothetical protein